MKKLLFLLFLFPAALNSMDSQYSYKKNTCNLGYFGMRLEPFNCIDNNYSRWEVFSNKECVGNVKYKKSTCTLNSLWIQEKYRGKKLGQALFLKALRDMKESGCRSVTWESEQDAIPFYKKYGARLFNLDCETIKGDRELRKPLCSMYISFIQEK